MYRKILSLAVVFAFCTIGYLCCSKETVVSPSQPESQATVIQKMVKYENSTYHVSITESKDSTVLLPGPDNDMVNNLLHRPSLGIAIDPDDSNTIWLYFDEDQRLAVIHEFKSRVPVSTALAKSEVSNQQIVDFYLNDNYSGAFSEFNAYEQQSCIYEQYPTACDRMNNFGLAHWYSLTTGQVISSPSMNDNVSSMKLYGYAGDGITVYVDANKSGASWSIGFPTKCVNGLGQTVPCPPSTGTISIPNCHNCRCWGIFGICICNWNDCISSFRFW